MISLALLMFLAVAIDARSVDVATIEPAKDEKRVEFAIDRWSWPVGAQVTIEVYESDDGGVTWSRNPVCKATTSGGPIMHDGAPVTQTKLNCRAISTDSRIADNKRRVRVSVTVTGATVDELITSTSTRK